MTVLNAVSTGLPAGTVTRTLISAEVPNPMASETEAPELTSVYEVPPLVEISTVNPAGTVGASSVNVSFALPLLRTVLTNTRGAGVVVLFPGAIFPGLDDLFE